MSDLESIKSKFVIQKNDKPKEVKNEEVIENGKEIKLEISRLVSFRKGQPFSLYDVNKKEEMKESIRNYGVIFPIIVRKIENDMYEIISGHNRVECSKELGLSTIPAKIVDCDDNKATLIMLETNLCNREKILPVEKGYAYKMKMDILKNNPNISNINDYIENSRIENDTNSAQIYRYIRLTELIKSLQEKVNIDLVPVTAGFEISYLSEEEQEIVNQVIEDEKIKITIAQAQKIRMKKNQITYEIVLKIFRNEKIKIEKFTGKIEKRAFKIYKDKFKSDREFTDLIMELLERYFESDSEK